MDEGRGMDQLQEDGGIDAALYGALPLGQPGEKCHEDRAHLLARGGTEQLYGTSQPLRLGREYFGKLAMEVVHQRCDGRLDLI